MDEKVLIKSEKSPIISRIIWIGVGLIVLAVILRIIFPSYGVESYSYDYPGKPVPIGYYIGGLILPSESMDWVVCPLLYIGVITIIYGVIFLIANRNVTLTVTDHRVYGTAKWGKRVDLPLDKISAVATAKLGGIAVSTSSGAIRFVGIKNNLEIHETISRLLMARQDKAAPPAAGVSAPQTKTDELRELKKLLDDGIISPEEFEAKKRQLLGL